jgi:hypothetical protein
VRFFALGSIAMVLAIWVEDGWLPGLGSLVAFTLAWGAWISGAFWLDMKNKARAEEQRQRIEEAEGRRWAREELLRKDPR